MAEDAATSPRRPDVFLLTSHAVAPPWDGGDKNLARTLLLQNSGVNYFFIGARGDRSSVWSSGRVPARLAFQDIKPTRRDKLRLLGWLILRPPRVDLVHVLVTFQNRAIQYALIALPLLERHRFVVTCPTATNLPLRLLRRSRAVVAISRRTERLLLSLNGPAVYRIAPGVDLERFQPPPSPAEQPLPIEPGPALLFAGHYDRGGGLDAALEVAAALQSRVPRLKLLIAMRLRAGEQAAVREAGLYERAAHFGVDHLVTSVGTVPDMRPFLHACGAILFQPTELGMKMELPMTLLEGLACGRPIVVSPTPPLDELADGSPAVMVAPAGDPRVIDHLERILLDPEHAGRCLTAARELAEERYGAPMMAAAYRQLYSSLT